jgi:hypothetical protein
MFGYILPLLKWKESVITFYKILHRGFKLRLYSLIQHCYAETCWSKSERIVMYAVCAFIWQQKHEYVNILVLYRLKFSDDQNQWFHC